MEYVAEVNFINMKFIASLEYELHLPIIITSCCIQIYLGYLIMMLLEKNAVPVNNIEPFQSAL